MGGDLGWLPGPDGWPSTWRPHDDLSPGPRHGDSRMSSTRADEAFRPLRTTPLWPRPSRNASNRCMPPPATPSSGRRAKTGPSARSSRISGGARDASGGRSRLRLAARADVGVASMTIADQPGQAEQGDGDARTGRAGLVATDGVRRRERHARRAGLGLGLTRRLVARRGAGLFAGFVARRGAGLFAGFPPLVARRGAGSSLASSLGVLDGSSCWLRRSAWSWSSLPPSGPTQMCERFRLPSFSMSESVADEGVVSGDDLPVQDLPGVLVRVDGDFTGGREETRSVRPRRPPVPVWDEAPEHLAGRQVDILAIVGVPASVPGDRRRQTEVIRGRTGDTAGIRSAPATRPALRAMGDGRRGRCGVARIDDACGEPFDAEADSASAPDG